MSANDKERAIREIQDLVKLTRSLAKSEGLEILQYLLAMAEQEISTQAGALDDTKIAS